MYAYEFQSHDWTGSIPPSLQSTFTYLPDAVRAVLGLRVAVRVPVRVVDDDRVGAREVDAQAARARGKEESEDGGVLVELLDALLPLVHLDAAVDAPVGPLAVPVSEVRWGGPS